MKSWIAMMSLFVCAAALAQQPAGDVKLLEGKWMVVSAELSGEALPKEATKSMLLTLTGEKYQFTDGKSNDQGTVKIDATKKPKEMDITGAEGPNKGKTFLAIYDIQGDTFRVCYDLTGKGRPSEFATKKGAALFLVTYQRAK